MVSGKALALDRLGLPWAGSHRGGSGAPEALALSERTGDVCLGRYPRAAHAADHVSPLHRDARTGDGQQPGIEAVVSEDAPRRGRQAGASGRERPLVRQARAWPSAHGSEVATAAELFDRLVPRLALRAREAGMELNVGPVESLSSVRVDISVVDQILTNLVDNAIKYAGSAVDHRIHLDAAASGKWLEIKLADGGPGLEAKVVRRLFRPFSKSANDAAHSAPGVGLGLALSRRLARRWAGICGWCEIALRERRFRSRFRSREPVNREFERDRESCRP